MAQVKPLDLSQVHDCQEAIGYTFQDELLLWEALQASGSLICHGTIPRYRAGNTRLAIVGDKLLDLLLSLEWYPTWHDRQTYSELREDVTSNRTLRIIGNRNKLGRYITLAENTATEVNTKIMSAAVRAIVGAAYMDGGTRAAKTVLGQLGFYQAIEDAIKLQESINDTDQHGPITRDTRKRKLSEVERESDPEPDPERIVLE